MGVRFERLVKDGPTRLISTDGRTILFLESEAAPDEGEACAFTVKSSAIATLPKSLDGSDLIRVAAVNRKLEIALPERWICFNDGIEEFTYPAYHQVLPSELVAGDGVTVNGDYLARIERAVDLYSVGKASPVLRIGWPNEQIEFFAGTSPKFYGLLMSMRVDGTATNSLSEKLKAERK